MAPSKHKEYQKHFLNTCSDLSNAKKLQLGLRGAQHNQSTLQIDGG